MLLVSDIIAHIKECLSWAEDTLRASAHYGTNSPGFNQDLGERDALANLLAWITEEDQPL